MLKRLMAILIAMFAVGCVTIEERLGGAKNNREIAQATADYYVNDVDVESCAVAIVSPGEVAFAHAGNADEHSLFRIASLSKLFLHPVLLKLHEEGRVNLDRPVTAYSKLDLPHEYDTVTLRDLLLNRSGLPREFLLEWNPIDMCNALLCGFVGTHIYGEFDSRDEFAHVARHPRWRRAIKKKSEVYSNMGFGLLGTAVEDSMGSSLEEILRNELAVPLNLFDTTYEPCGGQTNRLTRACAGDLPWLIRRKHDVPDHRLGSALRATGGLFSSASDCARVFDSYWAIIDEQLRERSIEAYSDDAVFGLLRVKKLKTGHRILYRAGMIYGGASFVGFDIQSRTIVVILRNVTSWPDSHDFTVMESLRMNQQPGNRSVTRGWNKIVKF